MKCGSCSIDIDEKFKFAITENRCPACGKSIMDSIQLASYISLLELFINNFGEEIKALPRDIARLVVANFELKQIFQQQKLPSSENSGTIETESEVIEGEDDSEPVFDDDGIRYEKIDKQKAKGMLQKMRDEALNEALNDRGDVDFSDDELLLLSDGSARQEQVLEAKRNNSRQKIQSGAGASFSRSE